MKPKPLLIAVALLAVLGGAVWYTRENPPPADDAAPKIIDLEEDSIREVTLRRAGEDPVTVVRGEDDKWEFGGGLEIAADDSSIGLMVSSLASLNADRMVSESVVDWAPYELDEPDLAVSYKLEDGGGELRFGRDTPTGSGVFARLEGDPRLFTVYSYNKTSFEKSVFDLRDKRLLRLDEDSISKMAVRAGGNVLEFVQSDGDWAIVKPMELRADDFTVNDLARVLRTAEMTAVLEEGEDVGSHSFDTPLAVATVDDEAGSHELVVAKDGESYYARSSDQGGVYAVSSTLAESFDKPVADFRNKKLFDFGFDDPARIDVRAGAETVAVVRTDDKWVMESHDGREADGESVQTLLDRLRGLTATEFPSDREADKARYGLAQPAIVATVTPQGEAAEAEKVLVSLPEEGPTHAARDGEPSTYTIERSAAQDIQRAVETLVAPPEPEESEGDPADGDSEDSGSE